MGRDRRVAYRLHDAQVVRRARVSIGTAETTMNVLEPNFRERGRCGKAGMCLRAIGQHTAEERRAHFLYPSRLGTWVRTLRSLYLALNLTRFIQ